MERQDAPVPAADVLLRDGGIAVIRPLVSEDLAEVRELHVCATDDAIRLRCFSSSRLSAQLMTESTVKSPPVVEDSRLVGMVSRTDVVRMLARRDERVEADIDGLIRSAGMDLLVEVEDGVAVLEGVGHRRM